MILNHVVFGDINYSPNIVSPPTRLLLTDAKYDRVKLDSDNITTPVSFEKKEWTGRTMFLADFEGNSLSSGSLGGLDDVTHVLLKKKRENDNEWVVVDKVILGDLYDGTYTFVDKNADPAERYEYAIVPCKGDVELVYYVQNVTTEMQTSYLYDRNKRYELYYNFAFDDFKFTMPNEKIETMGRRYPIVVYNNVLNYAESGISCLIYAGEDGEVDIHKERQLRREIMDFLTNKKPKAIKAYDGTNMMISIVGSPTLSPHSLGVYSLSFEFVEIGDMNNQMDLYTNNFIDIPVEAGGKP